MSIYDLTGQYKFLVDALLQNPDDVELKSEFEKIQDDLKTKAENYAYIIKNFEASVNVLDAEIKRLTERKAMFKNNIDRLKTNLMWSMKETGEVKFKTDKFSFSVAKNGGKAPLVMDVHTLELPDEFQKWDVEPDKEALRKYIEDTGDLSYAHFEERGEHLNIK